MGVDVYFTGLMLVCLAGQPNCPNHNTAWALKADGQKRVCGYRFSMKTTLEVVFHPQDFLYVPNGLTCANSRDGEVCTLPESAICIDALTEPHSHQNLGTNLRSLLHIDELDQRFRSVLKSRLEDRSLISNTIQFPAGSVQAGEMWAVPGTDPQRVTRGEPVLWQSSNPEKSGFQSRYLSDSIRVGYTTSEIKINNCRGTDLIKLVRTPSSGSGKIILRNQADSLKVDEGDRFEDLPYTLWYYQLASWWGTPSGTCPAYDKSKDSAAVLRCIRGTYGICSDKSKDPEASSKFWPPALLSEGSSSGRGGFGARSDRTLRPERMRGRIKRGRRALRG